MDGGAAPAAKVAEPVAPAAPAFEAPAPPAKADPWKQYTDEDSGKTFFYNAETQESAWTHP